MRGVEISAFARGTDSETAVDGLPWSVDPPQPGADLMVFDGYDIDPDELFPGAGGDGSEFWMHPPPRASRASLHLDLSGKPGTETLAGLSYACLREPYWPGPRRATDPRTTTILVTVGGTDAGGPVGALAQEVQRLVPNAHVIMVRGPQSYSALPPGIEVADAPGSLHGLFSRADVVVTAAGQTMLESLASGAPTVALVRAENQRRQADLAARTGAALVIEPDGLEGALGSLLSDHGRLAELAARGSTLVDGIGAHRVADQILRRTLGREHFNLRGLTLREVAAGDSDFLFALRNDPAAYANYRIPEPVEREDHERWLARTIEDEKTEASVIEEDGTPVGQIRVEPDAADPRSVELGISLLPGLRGRGIGRRAIAAACVSTWVRRGMQPIVAVVHPENGPSISAFRGQGFRGDERTEDGFLRLTLERQDFNWFEGEGRR